jgi:hypothetical protein
MFPVVGEDVDRVAKVFQVTPKSVLLATLPRVGAVKGFVGRDIDIVGGHRVDANPVTRKFIRACPIDACHQHR